MIREGQTLDRAGTTVEIVEIEGARSRSASGARTWSGPRNRGCGRWPCS